MTSYSSLQSSTAGGSDLLSKCICPTLIIQYHLSIILWNQPGQGNLRMLTPCSRVPLVKAFVSWFLVTLEVKDLFSLRIVSLANYGTQFILVAQNESSHKWNPSLFSLSVPGPVMVWAPYQPIRFLFAWDWGTGCLLLPVRVLCSSSHHLGPLLCPLPPLPDFQALPELHVGAFFSLLFDWIIEKYTLRFIYEEHTYA